MLWLEDITDGQPPTESLKHTAGGYKIFLEKYFTPTSFKFFKDYKFISAEHLLMGNY